MGKLAQSTSKYTIIAKFNSEGTVEKPDVIGALFGQTEGLLGQDMDLRELQKTGRIGRIDVDLIMKSGKASGEISIPSSLDSSETALIAACIETIERVGPCNAKIIVENIEDVRASKRKYVLERAKELLGKMFQDTMETQEMSEQIKESIRSAEVVQWRGLPAGPSVNQSDNIVVVEGRADVVNLLRCGIKNVVAIEGTSVPPQIADLAKEKEITTFLDGDRGGDLILRELTAVAEVDFVARAPEGKEVEELTKKEIYKALRERVPLDQAKEISAEKRDRRPERIERSEHAEHPEPAPLPKVSIEPEKAAFFREIVNEITGTRAACLLDAEGNILGKVPVREMFNAMREIKPEALVFDGEIDQKLLSFASQHGVKWIIGMRSAPRLSVPESMSILLTKDLQE